MIPNQTGVRRAILGILTVAVGAVGGLSTASRARAQDAASGDSDVATIRSHEDVSGEAITQRDSSALVPILAPSYKEVIQGRARNGTRAETLHETASPKDSAHHVTSLTFDKINVRVVGRDSAVAEGIYTERGTSPKGPFTDTNNFFDSWVRRHHRWVCVSSRYSPATAPATKPQ